MLFLAWFCLIMFIFGTILGSYRRIQHGEEFGKFIVTLGLQSCIIWCLVYLVMLL